VTGICARQAPVVVGSWWLILRWLYESTSINGMAHTGGDYGPFGF